MPAKIVSRDQWIEARVAHLRKEKELTHARDRLLEERRQLPWVRVEQDYPFDSERGPKRLADLFEGRSQLYGRGLEGLLTASAFPHMAPRGRNEADGIMNWVRLHNEYEDAAFAHSCCGQAEAAE